MRAFIFAVVAAFIMTGAAALLLESFQATSDRANTTAGARVDFARDGVNRTVKH